MKTIEVGYDPYVWAEVPLSFPCGEYGSQEQWAAAIGEAYTDGQDDAARTRPLLEQIAGVLPTGERPGLFEVLWYRPNPDVEPLLINVYVVPGAPYAEDSLSELAGAYAAEPIRPPVVDTLESAAFGSVARVVSVFRDDRHERLVMQLAVVGRSDEVVIKLEGFTSDLGHGTLASDDLVALMESIAVRDLDGPGLPGQGG